MIIKNKPYKFLLKGLIIAILILFGVSVIHHYFIGHSKSNMNKEFQYTLSSSFNKLTSTVDEFNESEMDEIWNSKEKSDHINTFLFKRDSLVFWSDHSVPIKSIWQYEYHQNLLQLKNGWYLSYFKEIGDYKLLGMALIKSQYPYQNRYLENEPGGLFRNMGEFSVMPISESEATGVSINDKNGFYVMFEGDEESSSLMSFILHAIMLLLWIWIIRNCYFIIHSKYGSGIRTIFGFSLFLLALRIGAQLTSYPDFFYTSDLFSAVHYAKSAWIPSLGDLGLNSIIILTLSFVFYSNIKNSKKSKDSLPFYGFVGIICFSGFLTFVVDVLIKTLVFDSGISFNINNLFELSIYSYIAIAILGLSMVSCLLILTSATRFFANGFSNFLSRKAKWVYTGIITLFFITVLVLAPNFISVLWGPLFIGVILLINISEFSFGNILMIIALFALFSSTRINHFYKEREIIERTVLAQKLLIEEDPVTELLYSEMEEELYRDEYLYTFYSDFENFDKTKLDQALSQKYFKGYLGKYNVKSYLFLSDGTALFPTDGDKRKHQKTYFESLNSEFGISTLGRDLMRINAPKERIDYLIHFQYPDKSYGGFRSVYLTMESLLVPTEIGFPELLLDRDAKIISDISEYAFARYSDGLLTKQYGNHQFPLKQNMFYNRENNEMVIANSEGFEHLILMNSTNQMVVLSKENQGLMASITSFSYLFAFFSLITLVFVIINELRKGNRVRNVQLNSKIQALLVFIIISSLILFGTGTIYYIVKQSGEKNFKNIKEKIHSVLIEVEHKLGEFESPQEAGKDYLAYILSKFSAVFFTDINLYNLKGDLISTSRPKVFNEGLISDKMDPDAFRMMEIKGKSEFVHTEQVGKMEYLSAYVPFRNSEGEVLAFLNLPYFAKQGELESEISSFLVALINIYVILFALSVMTALLISNFITQPLRLIQSTLGMMELGKRNNPIEYEGQDEIGALVSVYNQKVKELQESAEMLAQSERESAWREMAKQVAHEIKNPLTPMKLSIQHLQRTLKSKPENFEELLDRFSNTIIEQIDTLANIATEFSNFAKMPKAIQKKVDLDEVVQSCLELYKSSSSEVFLSTESENHLFILADRDQIIRVVHNLIKNAIQSIPLERKGKVVVKLYNKDNMVILEVEDNGIGISNELKDRIFQPNFTTKSSGTGLGLAMVKNIVEQCQGNISFTTTVHHGTSFIVRFPKTD